MTVPPWRIPGPIDGPAGPGLEHALKLLHKAERRPPTEADVPPPSTFPVTAAARVALKLTRQSEKRKRQGAA